MTSGHTPEVVVLDIGDYASIRQAARDVISRVGHVDILVNNAGQSFRGAAINTDIAVHERMMKVNYFGQIVLTQGKGQSSKFKVQNFQYSFLFGSLPHLIITQRLGIWNDFRAVSTGKLWLSHPCLSPSDNVITLSSAYQ